MKLFMISNGASRTYNYVVAQSEDVAKRTFMLDRTKTGEWIGSLRIEEIHHVGDYDIQLFYNPIL